MNRQKFLPVIIICCMAVIIFLCWQFIYVPVQDKILNMQIETRRLRAIEKNLGDIKTRHKNFAEFVEITDIRLEELKNYLPEKPVTEKFTAEIYKIAAKNKIAVTNLQVGELVFMEDNNLQRQSIKIKLEGNYISILNFIREIIDGERFTKLENILLENNQENFINCEIEFYIYSRTGKS